MKKQFTLAALAVTFLSTTAFAQPKKGSWMAGADILSSGAYISSNSSQFNFNLMPKAGYFVTDKLTVGSSLTLGAAFGSSNSYSISYGITPFARYFFAGKDGIQLGKLTPFAEAYAGYGGSTWVDKVNDVKNTISGLNAGGGVGLSYFINSNVSVEASYNLNHSSQLTNTYNNIFNTNKFTHGIKFGFQIYFNRKNKNAEAAE